MKTYTFKVVMEADEDGWHVYCPALVEQGAATWGQTPEEAMRNIQEVVEMVIESLIEDGERIPEEPNNQAQVSDVPEVSVTV